MMEYLTRMGDGRRITMNAQQIKDDLEKGTKYAAEVAHIPELTGNELEQLFEIITNPNKIVSVQPGKEVVTTNDVGTLKVMGDQANSGVNIPVSREEAMVIYERSYCTDTAELAHIDYSFKPIKPIISQEQSVLQNVQQMTIIPIFYGAMPNLGLYYAPEGPFPDPLVLIRMGKISEAREAMEKAAERFIGDFVYVTTRLYDVGLDGINIDTTAASGDPDFYASLIAAEKIKKKCPNLSVEMGMAGEFILGFTPSLSTQASVWRACGHINRLRWLKKRELTYLDQL